MLFQEEIKINKLHLKYSKLDEKSRISFIYFNG